MADDFETPALSAEWISIRRFPRELADLSTPGRLRLVGDGSTLDDPRPVFVGRRHATGRRSICDVDARAGPGGLGVRFDELHHYEIEVGAGTVTARAVVAGIRQEWSCPAPADVVTLHLDCVPPTGTQLLDFLTGDVVVLGVSSSPTRRRSNWRAWTAATCHRRRRLPLPAGSSACTRLTAR